MLLHFFLKFSLKIEKHRVVMFISRYTLHKILCHITFVWMFIWMSSHA